MRFSIKFTPILPMFVYMCNVFLINMRTYIRTHTYILAYVCIWLCVRALCAYVCLFNVKCLFTCAPYPIIKRQQQFRFVIAI